MGPLKILVLFVAILNTAYGDEDLETKVYKGTKAVANQFPYMVSLQYKQKEHGDKTFKHCGGAVLDSRWIITAAHCFSEAHTASSLFINAGVTDAYDYGDKSQRSTYKRFIPKEYDPQTDANDICLLRLDTPLKIGKNVAPINLPPAGYVASGEGEVMGWGSIDVENSKTSRDLLFAKISVFPLTKCQNIPYIVDETQICVGIKVGQPAACEGDSGGPFVQQVDGKPTVVGVLSYGHELCAQLPSVYTNVASHLKFISDTRAANK